MTYDEACRKEIELIAQFNATDHQYGYNISGGGNIPNIDNLVRQWSDPQYKDDMKRRMKSAWKDPEKRKRRSEQATARWQDAEFKAKTVEQVIATCHRTIRCIETNEVFYTMADAATKYNVSRGNLTRACKTGYKCGGHHWEYVDDVL